MNYLKLSVTLLGRIAFGIALCSQVAVEATGTPMPLFEQVSTVYRFDLARVDTHRQRLRQKYDTICRKRNLYLGISALSAATLIGSGVWFVNRPGLSSASLPERAPSSPASEKESDEIAKKFLQYLAEERHRSTSMIDMFKQSTAKTAGFLLVSGAIACSIPVAQVLYSKVRELVNLSLHGYKYWGEEQILNCTEELQDLREMLLQLEKHEATALVMKRNGDVEKCYRGNVINKYHGILGAYERALALMLLQTHDSENQKLVIKQGNAIGSLMNAFASSLEHDFSMPHHGLMPYCSRETTEIFLRLAEACEIFFQEYRHFIDIN